MSFYHRLSFELPAGEEEWLSLELFARGAEGLSVEEALGERSREVVRLVAYCSDPPPAELDAAALERAGESWAARGIQLLARERCKARDWLAAYRAATAPTEIGRRFLVDPREPEDVGTRASRVPAGRVLLRVPARRAFGTGSHASTRLVLEWLESLDLEGRRVLDLGTGAGILSMAAVALGASVAVGIDADPVACIVATEIRRLNPQRTLLAAGSLACLRPDRFDLALVNILPAEWLAESEALARVLAPDGEAIVSGLPSEQADEVSDRLAETGLEEVEHRHDGEWAALRIRRTAR